MLNLQAYHPWIAVLVTVLVFVGLQLRRGASADLLFLCGLVMVTLTGVIGVEDALAGFANPAVITIGGLLVVAAGLRSAGVLDWVGHRLLGSVHTERAALTRLAATLVATSAFLLNTALVAMMAPLVVDWCRRRNISPSRLLIPVSYLTILGGVCTLIGTSTTLVVNGMLVREHQERLAEKAEFETRQPQDDQQQAERPGKLARLDAIARGVRPLGLFEIGLVGLPCALVGTGFLLLLGRRLLPNRTGLIEQLDEHRREYLVEMMVRPDCRLIGQTVQQAGLRQLPGLFLIEIDRAGDIITPVTPQDAIHSGDRLIFTGIVSTIVDLEKIPGLVPAADTTYEFQPRKRQQRHLTEVVLSRTSPLIGATVREANFRQRYGAAVVAVHRNGVRLTNKIGNIALEPGDTLLLQTRNEFVPTYRNSRDFYLISSVEGSQAIRHDKAPLAAALALLLIAWLVLTTWTQNLAGASGLIGLSSPAMASLTIATLMILTRCLRASEARGAIDLQLLLTIAAALGLGRALGDSGAAQSIAEALVGAVGQHPYLLLIVVYLLAMVFTELISNAAVAVMMFPVAVQVATVGGCSPRPFVMALALAASLSFITPIGYQTNLMVMGPGGYRPIDYLRVGIPIAIPVAITALVLIPIFWPL